MIRPYQEKDFDAVTALWFNAMLVAIPDLMKRMGHTLEGSLDYFRNGILAENQLWVYELDGKPVAFLALKDDFIDRLYVAPEFHRRGIGQALLDHARTLYPYHLWLFTDQVNAMARSFYEKNGFIATRFGVTPPPQSEPDVEYHWYLK